MFAGGFKKTVKSVKKSPKEVPVNDSNKEKDAEETLKRLKERPANQEKKLRRRVGPSQTGYRTPRTGDEKKKRFELTLQRWVGRKAAQVNIKRENGKRGGWTWQGGKLKGRHKLENDDGDLLGRVRNGGTARPRSVQEKNQSAQT